jgi:hypothetical protein
METSLFIARIIGVIYFSFGVGLLLNSNYYKNAMEKLLDNTFNMLLGGFFAIIIGFFIIESHDIWTDAWTSIISIIGWIALIKGILILAFPRFFAVFKPVFAGKMMTYLIMPLVLILGLFFLYYGFLM